jgi:hypothetical protein
MMIDTGEAAQGHVRVRCHVIDRDGLGQATRHPGVQRRESRSALLCFQWFAELRLAPGPLQEDDDVGRRSHCCGVAEILLDQGETQIHSRRHAGGRADAAVANEQRRSVHLERRIRRLEPGRPRPVRGHSAALQQAGAGQDKGAGADRAHSARASRIFRNPVLEFHRMLEVVTSASAGDEQGIDGFVIYRSERDGADAQASAARDRPTVNGRDRQPVRRLGGRACGQPVGGREGLQRAAEIQQVEAVVDEQDDVAADGACRLAHVNASPGGHPTDIRCPAPHSGRCPCRSGGR